MSNLRTIFLSAVISACLIPTTSFAQGNAQKAKSAVMIIAHENYQDRELIDPKTVLEEAGVKVKIASSDLSPAAGVLGGSVSPDLLVSEVRAGDYDAVIFVGGPGATQYWDDPAAHRLAQETVRAGKILGAICIAPVTLSNAGVLAGKKATVWSSEAANMSSFGAEYTGKPVEQDGNIITASGPSAAKDFGRAILRALESK